jgi:hypothetical protein
MKVRHNPHIIAIIPHDGSGNRAPELLVDTTGIKPENRYKFAREEAKKRSGLAAHNWRFA